MKLKTAISYRLTYQTRSLLIYMVYFTVFACLMPLLAIFLSDTTEIVHSDIIFSAICFMFILALVGIHSDFKLFIQNGLSRQNIFLTNIWTNTLISVGFSGLLVLIQKLFDRPLISGFRFEIFLVDLYSKNAFFPSWFLLSLFLFFASTIGVVIGTFNELFSGIHKILIILALIMIPTVVGFLFQTIDKQITMNILEFLKEIIGISSTGLNIWPLVGTLWVLITINLLLSFLMNQKREIKRING